MIYKLISSACAAAFLVAGSMSSFAGSLETADGFFYNDQYDRAASEYVRVLNDSSYGKSTKSKVLFKVGLAYFLTGDLQKAGSYWREARAENAGWDKGKTFRVPLDGMSPQLLPGDLILVDDEYFQHKPVSRTNVVYFLDPQLRKTLHISRVMGMPGDQFQIKNNVVIINGMTLFDKYANFFPPSSPSIRRDNFGPIQIPTDKYFLLGDNRNNSRDSRDFGLVDGDLILGRAMAIYGSSADNYSRENISTTRMGMIVR